MEGGVGVVIVVLRVLRRREPDGGGVEATRRGAATQRPGAQVGRVRRRRAIPETGVVVRVVQPELTHVWGTTDVRYNAETGYMRGKTLWSTLKCLYYLRN